MLTEEEKKKINTGTPAATESPAATGTTAAPTAPATPTVPESPAVPATHETPATPATTTTSTPDYTSMVVKDITTFGDKTKREPKEETTSKVDDTSSNVDDTSYKVYETLYKRGYDRLSDILEQARDRYKPETKEEREKRERKEKSKKIVAAITDGLNSLSNLYFTTQYAPNMYDHEKQSTLKPYEERLEKEKKDREANNDKYDALNMKLAENEINSAKTMRELQAALEKRRIEIEKNRRDAEQHEWKRILMPYQYDSERYKADKAESDAFISKTNADYAEAIAEEKLKALEALTELRKSGANKNNRWKPSGGRGKGGKQKHVAYDRDGNAHYFNTKGEADDYAKAHGTYVYSTSSTSKGFSEGGTEVSTTTRTGGYRKRPQKSTQKNKSLDDACEKLSFRK